MKSLLLKVSKAIPLSESETYELFKAFLVSGESALSDAQIGAYLCGTSVRRPIADELVGAARALREHMIKVNVRAFAPGISLLDTCGTGGSGLNAFNTSTASAFVVAASGQAVAKHGNRGISSASGSADVLQALEISLDLSPEQIARCIAETKFGFIFAPHHHPATKRVAAIRRDLGFRTIFNFLGPLVNPASVEYQVLGVSDRAMVSEMAQALLRLGVKRALVLCGDDGLDEATLSGETTVCEVNSGAVNSYKIAPEDFGLTRRNISEFVVKDPKTSAEQLKLILQGEQNPCRDLVQLNAACALYICGKSDSVKDALILAGDILVSGKPYQTLLAVKAFSDACHHEH